MTLTKVLRDAGLNGQATAHGFRSSGGVWCAEVAKVRDEVSEAALAHKIPDKVRAAYLRTRFLDERRHVMQRLTSPLRDAVRMRNSKARGVAAQPSRPEGATRTPAHWRSALLDDARAFACGSRAGLG